MNGWGNFCNVLFMSSAVIDWCCFSFLEDPWFTRGSEDLCYVFLPLAIFTHLLFVILAISSNAITQVAFISFLVSISQLLERSCHGHAEKTVSFYQLLLCLNSIQHTPFVIMLFLSVLDFCKKLYITKQNYWFFFPSAS